MLKKEIDHLDHFNRKETITSLLNEMKEREKRLFFFENEDEIDLQIEEKHLLSTLGKSTDQSRKDKASADIGYVPPEVHATRNK